MSEETQKIKIIKFIFNLRQKTCLMKRIK